MKIKSGGFPLLKLRIAKDEYLPGYIVNQLLYGARGETQREFRDSDPHIRRISWKVISDIRRLVERSDLGLPSVHECIIGHTLYPLFAWCLSTKDAQELYEQYANTVESSVLRKRGKVFIANKSYATLAWCKQCTSDHVSASLLAFPIWHRLHFAPNILVCHAHNIPLSTLCEECLDENWGHQKNWTPTLECLCKNDLKDRVHMGVKMLNAMCSITSKADEILQGKTCPEFTPLAIKQAIRKRFPHGLFKKGKSRVAQILDAVVENIGEEAAEILNFNEQTVHLFITGENALFINNPVHILAFGYASFKGFDGLVKSINESTKCAPENNKSSAFNKERLTIQGRKKKPTRKEFEHLVAKMTRSERRILEQEGRAWLLEKLQRNPGLTRYDFWNRHRRQDHKFFYLVWIDTDWYRRRLPSADTINANEKKVASFKSPIQITSKLIYERRAIELEENPLRKITKSILMQPLKYGEVQAMESYDPEIRKALSACVEKKDDWKKRAVYALSQMISKHDPTHQYTDVNWYIGARTRTFNYRFNKAKRWLLNLKDQH